ncbi:NTE family protein [Thermotomaculum hydrothermale]|uniref:NTE family protein n=1 Tax=Thermotomaculum hydrothermale TaxID=981385 RepID=A0A7R6PNQ1_9BACT|nr:patatin-like phospholipase family protein [Thermotomaculum hydrothermale]BBB32963.1 NTE family protein [Thermotomaculum hydrothermale]
MKSKLGISLGGGAARGYAHLGVLKVLEENGIKPSFITGTSMGAVLGGLYAYFGNIEETINHLVEFLKTTDTINQKIYKVIIESEKEPVNFVENIMQFVRKGIIYGKALTSKSMVPEEVFNKVFDNLIPDVNIEDLKIPFGVIVTEITEGEELMVTKGNLKKALKASSAIPGVYPPLIDGDKIYIDGGWTNKNPVRPCYQLGASEVIAVCVARELEDTSDFQIGMDLIIRSNAVSMHRLGQLQKEEASLVLYPKVEHIHWADFARYEEGIASGIECAKNELKEIKKIYGRSKWTGLIKSKKKYIREISL